MKKVLIAIMLMAGFTAVAQRGERGEKGHRGDFKSMTAEQMATLQTKKMTLALDLTSNQQNKIQALNLENAEQSKAKMEERKAAKESSEQKKPTSDEIYAMKKARLDAAIAHKASLKDILTPEQFEKWETHRKKRGEHKKHRHLKGEKGKRKH
ncbi:hypothetical protein [Maribacter sp. HTCC2170]|uniref:hypothetical protein n=1 Tax=Maribacter sp. (strain HTCC2170 / KCCM 42371) TaxID=313603 RepID=UPI00006AE5EA|nr:hypothetical protein [Maribacter sp. HTCC2170]EAR00611.1 hypothetical protein FB2170_08899 [Maribacter sp. HTCC2170]